MKHLYQLGLTLTEDKIKQLTLIELKTHLQNYGCSLKEFKTMPYPKDFVINFLSNKLIYNERQYNPNEKNEIFHGLFTSLTDKQRDIFNEIIETVQTQQGGVFFMYGYGGTGKTFM
ncbi:unnamed protein product [Lathyrus sativus]|nr:unnamed protein product [Lathyrus sativus]